MELHRRHGALGRAGPPVRPPSGGDKPAVCAPAPWCPGGAPCTPHGGASSRSARAQGARTAGPRSSCSCSFPRTLLAGLLVAAAWLPKGAPCPLCGVQGRCHAHAEPRLLAHWRSRAMPLCCLAKQGPACTCQALGKALRPPICHQQSLAREGGAGSLSFGLEVQILLQYSE